MIPIGKSNKAYEAGYKARKEGVELKDNPNKFGPYVALSSWWESGWYAANNEPPVTDGELSRRQK